MPVDLYVGSGFSGCGFDGPVRFAMSRLSLAQLVSGTCWATAFHYVSAHVCIMKC